MSCGCEDLKRESQPGVSVPTDLIQSRFADKDLEGPGLPLTFVGF
jgi:hypothetical protein